MKKKAMCKGVLIGFLILLLAVPPGVFGQDTGSPAPFSQEQLDQMLAPIALYPDSLLAQVLVASTYPLEVVEADRWVKANGNLKGDQFNDAIDKMSWDLSVKALAPFPGVLSMMSEKLDWTQRLGDAFLAQQAQVMETIQKLRAKAQAQGNLQTTKEQKVIVQDQAIVIEPANPSVVYVPTYNPAVVYGSWWYPAYPPYPYYPAGAAITAGVIGFAAGIAVGAAWNSGWGHWNWGGGSINCNVNRNVNINRSNLNVSNIQTGRWQHDAAHRKGVAYRDQATRDRFTPNRGGSAEARRDFRGYSPDGRGRGQGDFGRPGGGQLADRRPSERPGAGAGGRPNAASTLQGMQGQRPGGGAAGTRPGGEGALKGARERQGSGGAFQGVGNGRETRMNADRGRASRQESAASIRSQGGGGRAGGGGAAAGARAGGGGGGRGGGGRGGRR